MTDVNRYRDGELSSTALMQEAMERAHAVAPGEGAKLEWHKDHESMDQARARMHDEPATVMKWVAATVIGVGAAKVSKDALKSAPDLLDAPWKAAKSEANDAAKYAGRLAAATLAVPSAGTLAVVAAVAEVVHAFRQGDDLSRCADVDAMDVTVTNLLDLDPSFKASEWRKYPGIASDRTMALFKDDSGAPTEFGRKHIPELQAAADAGARAALDARNCGDTFDGYLAERPDIKKRCDDDVAFSKGFANVRFLAHQSGGKERLRALEVRLDERDARSFATATTVRG